MGPERGGRPGGRPCLSLGSAQAADGRLAMNASDATVLIEDSSLADLDGLLVPRPQRIRVLPARSFGYGASFPVSSGTPVLRHWLHVR